MTSFKSLGLSAPVLRAIEELGFETPSEIQAKGIPELLSRETDFIGLAQTGTGKTAAFGLPLIEKIDPSVPHTQALILTPTRELGQQVGEQLALFSKYCERINTLTVYGGANIATQIKELRKPTHVIIATPGRLLDLLKRKAINLKSLEYLILDEADEMLNMGFKEDLDLILKFAPQERVTWLFSATFSKEIRRIVKQYMVDPIELRINPSQEVNKLIEHQYVLVNRSNKMESLTRFLDEDPDIRGIVFTRTKRDAQDLAEKLLSLQYKADALHGDLSQNQRDRVMNRFKAHELHVLIATDVAARGIDVNDLTHVFHYNLPDDNAYYTHRSGRTARAGKSGKSLVFASDAERRKLNGLERDLKISFAKINVPTWEEVKANRLTQFAKDLAALPVGTELDDGTWDAIKPIFADMTMEALLAKVLVKEFQGLSKGSNKDLNAVATEGKGRSGGRGKFGRDRKGSGRGKFGRDRKGGGNRTFGKRKGDGGKPKGGGSFKRKRRD